MKKTGIINKIIPFSNVDGPGNRTAVFFQGCNLKCLYCHNPETIHHCRGCGACVPVCPVGALTFEEGDSYPLPEAGEGAPKGRVRATCCKQPLWHPSKCVSCDACIKACPHLSSPKVRFMTAEEVAAEIRKTAPYINGVSFSGGECTLQRDFLLELIPLIRDMGLGVLLDSNGTYDFEQDSELLNMIEGVMLDIKAADKDFCLSLTGAGPEMPLKNLEYLKSAGKLTEVRTVLLPVGEGDFFKKQNTLTVRSVAKLLGPDIPYKLLRYRPFGVRQEGLDYLGSEIPTEEQGEALAELVRSLGAQGRLV